MNEKLSIKNLDYEKIKKIIYEDYCYTANSLAKYCGIGKSLIYNFFDQNAKHSYWQDLYILIKISNKLHIDFQKLICV